MYIGVGILIALILLHLTGRLRTERYQEAASEAELLAFLGDVESKSKEDKNVTMESVDSDSDSDSDAE